MNNRVVINPKTILDLDFRSIGTYKLLLYIYYNFDIELKKVRIDVYEIAESLNITAKTLKNSLNELIDKKVISKIDNYKYWYKLNKEELYARKIDNK